MTAQVWFRNRQDVLQALAAHETFPLLVVDDETLNDTLFDLLSIEDLELIYYAVNARTHPRIAEKIYTLTAGFRSASFSVIRRIMKRFSGMTPEKLMFLPDAAQVEDFEEAFEQGVPVGLSHLLPLQLRPEIFREKEVSLAIEQGAFRAVGWNQPRDFRRPRKGFALSELGAVQARLKAHRVSVTGVFLRGDSTRAGSSFWEDVTSALARVLSLFPSVKALFLSEEAGIAAKTEFGILDMPLLKERLRAVKAQFPQLTCILEAGPRLLSHARVLLTRVRGIERKNETICLSLGIGRDIPAQDSPCGFQHEVVNLSTRGCGEAVPVRSIEMKETTGLVLCCETRLPLPRVDDILLVSNMGACAPDAEWTPLEEGTWPEHYLLARKMCPVKI